MKKPKIGEIWLVTIPELFYEQDESINIKIQTRPFLVLDDGRGLIVEADYRNYHCFKLTSQYDKYKRKPIKNWKEKGLLKKSYIRIEMPLKIEEKQFKRKISELNTLEMIEVYKELYKIINVKTLEKISETV